MSGSYSVPIEWVGFLFVLLVMALMMVVHIFVPGVGL